MGQVGSRRPSGEGIDEQTDVLARLEAADPEDVRHVAEIEPASHLGNLVVARDGEVDAVRHDPDAFGRDRRVRDELVGCGAATR